MCKLLLIYLKTETLEKFHTLETEVNRTLIYYAFNELRVTLLDKSLIVWFELAWR